MGPEAGAMGGEVLFEGSYEELKSGNTLTGKLLREHKGIKSPVRKVEECFELKNLTHHNLKGLNVRLPKGLFTVIAGVAGSGKSSLMQAFHDQVGEDVTLISQKSIGANLRSTPATYLGVADDIRKLFSKEWDCFRSTVKVRARFVKGKV